MSEEPHKKTEANVSVIAVIFLVTLTVISAGSLFVAVTEFGVPEPDYPPFEDKKSPFSVEYVEGTLAGNPVETALYDSTTGEESEYGFEGSRKAPPSVDEAVEREVSGLSGATSLPWSDPDVVVVDSGDYYADSGSHIWSGWDDKRVVFDTTDGPVNIAVDQGGRIVSKDTRFEISGSHHVEVYLKRSPSALTDIRMTNVTFENRRTGAFRIYAQPDTDSEEAEIKIEESTYRGIVYAPGTTVEFEDSTVYGASVADETFLDGSSYYHDENLERLGTDVLP